MNHELLFLAEVLVFGAGVSGWGGWRTCVCNRS